MSETQKQKSERLPNSQKQKSSLRDRVRELLASNKMCELAFDELENDDEVETMLEDANRMAIDRLGFSDHGHTHSLIVTMNGIHLLRVLSSGVQPTIVQEQTGTFEDSELVVLLACYLHDIGMSIHRERHNVFSVTVATPIVSRILDKVYPKDRHKQAHIRGHVLHAIFCHDKLITPSSIEAGVVGVADALDMTKGRARIPFQAGRVNIHSASAMAINKVDIKRGEEKTVRIEVSMSNASGIFQIQELLERKIRNAAQLLDHIELYAIMAGEEDRILGEQLRVL